MTAASLPVRWVVGLLLKSKKCWLAATVAVLATAIAWWAMFPPRDLHKPSGRAVFDARGRLLRLTISGDEKYRLWTPLSEMPQDLIQLVLLHEDRHFRFHPGVNPVALVRAALKTYSGGRRFGASTITMQVARLLYGINSRSIGGKLRQVARAVQLEMRYSKRDILEAYLNLAPYGHNIEGVGAASLIYFRKPASSLDLYESLALALIPQDPNRKALAAVGENFMTERLRLARRWQDSTGQALDDERLRMPLAVNDRRQIPFRAPHFTDAVMQVFPGRHVFQTLLDLDLQNVLESEIHGYLKELSPLGLENAAAVLIDHRTMDIRAMVGSADFSNAAMQGQVNAATSRRSPGSLLKPFMYGLAFDQGLLHSMSLVKDAPSALGPYAPSNFDSEFQGPLTVTAALNRSRNVPAVATAARLQNPDLYDFLHRLGLGDLKPREHYGASLVLGTAEMTMLELAELYSLLAHQGRFQSVRWLKDQPSAAAGIDVLSPEASFMVAEILYQNPRPAMNYQKTLVLESSDVAWKTGTSWAFRDAWSAGIFGPYVLVVWLGNFDGRSDPHFVGGSLAGPLFFRMVDHLAARHGAFRHVVYTYPKDLAEVEVCALSGGLPTPFCPVKVKTHFIAGKSPIEPCAIHRQVEVDRISGERVCPGAPHGPTRMQVFEFWPSDLSQLFARAGLARRSPPALSPACRSEGQGKTPDIISPRLGLVYRLRSHEPDKAQNRLALEASVDGDARRLFWFADQDFLGSTERGGALWWNPTAGRHLLQVMDDQGRSASRRVEIAYID